MEKRKREIEARTAQVREAVLSVVTSSLFRLCGGGGACQRANQVSDCDNVWREQLRKQAEKSVSFPNGGHPAFICTDTDYDDDAFSGGNEIVGKPHDVEVRVCLSYFHRYKHRKPVCTSPSPSASASTFLETTSDMGLRRTFASPVAFAEKLILIMEEETESSKHMSEKDQRYDMRSDRSGVICIVTPDRAMQLRQAGRLPCPTCIKWCKGEKGLWWHQQKEHSLHHSTAVVKAAAQVLCHESAIIPYNNQPNHIHPFQTTTPPSTPNPQPPPTTTNTTRPLCNSKDSLLLQHLQRPPNTLHLPTFLLTMSNAHINPQTYVDKNGANILHWAAGQGHLALVQHLVEHLSCPAHAPQLGRRAFKGRTPLHWACRMGHFEVVKYLVENCRVEGQQQKEEVDQATEDGTTAFCWASWQGHLNIMRFLHSHGCDIHKKNVYGCNAVLWCAQGDTKKETSTSKPHLLHKRPNENKKQPAISKTAHEETLTKARPKGKLMEAMLWLRSIGCDFQALNSNGHGVLHKAAQRGSMELCQWLLREDENGHSHSLKQNSDGDECIKTVEVSLSLQWDWDVQHVAPDREGCCPSDLAGMEQHQDLAVWLAEQEVRLVENWWLKQYKKQARLQDFGNYPPWLAQQVEYVKQAGYNHVRQKYSKVEMSPAAKKHKKQQESCMVWEPWAGARRMATTVAILERDQEEKKLDA